ncbi:hypothetical protein [Aestuariispira insulae]|uniref:Uncharacterized protein n=1 Tax=Aestuariispira insulae TaxID=1461337 RepID=A0A3D9HPY5_9PROT|nr:hypothetical protein [Aestuariispira insulae]RED51548.1 hypothetical protein DFP90_103351 [Aestuariispira insulae]
MNIVKTLSFSVAAVALTFGTALPISSVSAEEAYEQSIREVVEAKLRGVLSDSVVIEAIQEQNLRHQKLQLADIDRLDKEWRAQVDAAAKPLITEVLNKPVSDYLREVLISGKGLYTEIIVMDSKGLNVGASTITSDYWQGDEAKFTKTFVQGKDAMFVDAVEMDESTQTLQSQVSFTIVDPVSGQPVGAVTVGINMDEL